MPPAPATSRLRLIPILLAQGIGVGCGVAGVKVNSSLLTPDVLGVYGVFLTFAPIGMWVVHAGLLKFTARHWAAAASRSDLLRAIARAWGRRLPWLAVAGALGAWALAGLAPGHVGVLATSLCVAAALLAAGALTQSALQAEGAHWRDCGVTIATSVSRTFAPPLLFLATGGLTAALWLGFAFHAAVSAVTGIWMLRAYLRKTTPSPAGPPVIAATYEGALFLALAAASWTLAGLNRWIVAGFFGETEAGYFTLAGGAAMVITSALGAAFMQYFQPGLFALADGPAADRPRLARRVDQVAFGYAAVALLAVGIFAVLAPWLVGPLINPAYRAALPWILPAGCYGVALITIHFYQTLLLAGRRERACGPVELTTAAVLAGGCLLAARAGSEWFARWLLVTPFVPWLLTRALARRFFFPPDAAATPGPAR